MSDETRPAMDYLVRALAASVRDGQRAIDAADIEAPGLCGAHQLGVILRRMRSDLGELGALLRETQKNAPVRRKRRKRSGEAQPHPGAVSIVAIPGLPSAAAGAPDVTTFSTLPARTPE